ncbi:hypothetical protein ACLI1A_17010 [Flavobacterium sp. RHBU_3]|uniref:hypothetical protein n=1 Tax=Flavobacterium sp. RHBU_3 TaxID=3391184 RepID=UPI00398520ED
MDKIMEQVREFILHFLAKEADCWSKSHLNDLDAFNQTVRELYGMAIDELDEGLGIFEEDSLTEKENPIEYVPRHLYKLSTYQNKNYGDIWVAYTSIQNPTDKPVENIISEGFIIAQIEKELKIIGTMSTYLNRSTMAVMGWKASIYNPSDLDIKKLGKFILTERYSEPSNYDNFSLNEYLKDS